MRPRPPCCVESIAARKALRARPASCTTGPTCRLPRRRRRGRDAREPGCRSGASLEVFVPCNAHWRRSRCPGRPASGRSRFDASSPAARASALCRGGLSGVDDFSRALAVFRSCGFRAMKLAWRTCRVVGVPAESVARRPATFLPLLEARSPGVATARRPVALTTTSSIARPGETGVTGPKRHAPAGTPAAGFSYVVTRRARPVPLKRLRTDSAARPGSFAKSRLLRVAFRYPFEPQRCLAGRRRSFPSACVRRPTAFMGFSSLRPSQV